MISNTAKKKILVTGSNGLLGQKLVYLLREKEDIFLIATSKGENRLNEKSDYVYESVDITDKNKLEKIVSDYSPDCIINTAAMTNVDACETKRKECIEINVESVETLVNVITKRQALNSKHLTQLVHLSTDFVFDGTGGPYTEEDKPNPLSFYAQSKYDSEKIIQQSSIPWTIIRTIIIYGLSENMSRMNLVLWVLKSLSKSERIRVVNDQFRSPTLAEDLATACLSAALKNRTGIYHVSGSETKSILELAYEVADFFHLDKSLIEPVSSAELKQPARRPQRTGFVITKAIRELDFNPYSFMKGLGIVKKQIEESGWLDKIKD
ncbi:MAG: SDR family oxidoreductase [Bacteroidia bacterium]|nr:SDR family oxidoreductase [Bacteroidia bacterium]